MTGVSDRVKSVCKIGKGHQCCRFLIADGNGFHCAKWSELAATINRRVAIDEGWTARGDNCVGRPVDEAL